MGQMNAGLPQVAPVFKLPIGSTLVFTQGVPAKLTLGDGTTWMETGKAVSYEPKYAEAMKLNFLKTFAVSTAGAMGQTMTLASYQHASNGAGIVLLASNGTTQYQRSTDGGRTWTTPTESYSGASIVAFLWAGNRFIMVTADSTNLVFYYSATGAQGSWTLGSTFNGLTTASASVRAAYNPATGTVVVTRANAVTTEGIYRCTANATFSNRTAPAVFLGPVVACSPTRWVVASSQSAVLYYSDDDGLTWQTGTHAAAAGTGRPALGYVGGGWVYWESNSTLSNYYYSATGIGGWTVKSAGATNSGSAITYSVLTLSLDGTRLYALLPNGAAWTSDGLVWETVWFDRSVTTGLILLDVGSFGMCLGPSNGSGTVSYYLTKQPTDASEFVGLFKAIITETNGGHMFARIA